MTPRTNSANEIRRNKHLKKKNVKKKKVMKITECPKYFPGTRNVFLQTECENAL